jgi:hypothetical protein
MDNLDLPDDLKQSIIALAEAVSDDEEAEDAFDSSAWRPAGRRDDLQEIGAEDWSDDEYVYDRLRPARTGESDEEADDTPEASIDNNPFNSKVVEILCRTYLNYGLQVLLRANPNQETPQHKALMRELKENGWPATHGDDLIDSWARELDRAVCPYAHV